MILSTPYDQQGYQILHHRIGSYYFFQFVSIKAPLTNEDDDQSMNWTQAGRDGGKGYSGNKVHMKSAVTSLIERDFLMKFFFYFMQ